MFRWQLPPFLIFGIYMTFVHSFFRRQPDKWDEEYFEDEAVKRVKRRIEVKWGIYCILSLLLWLILIAGIVVLILRNDGAAERRRLMRRWMAGPLVDSWKIIV
jgi:hypothetical protein